MPASPAMAEKLAMDTVERYREAERLLLRQMAANLAKGIDAPHWKEQKLAQIQAYLKQAERLLVALREEVKTEAQTAMVKAYEQGGMQAVRDIDAMGLQTVEPLAGQMAVEAMAAEVARDLAATHPGILRSISDAYDRALRDPVASGAAQVLMGTMTRRQATQQVLDDFAKAGIRGFVDKRGRGWTLEAYAEMAMRTACGRAAVQGHVDTIVANGLNLVIVSDAPKECPLCRPWEGKVLRIGGPVVVGEQPQGPATVETMDAELAARAKALDLTPHPAVVKNVPRPYGVEYEPLPDYARIGLAKAHQLEGGRFPPNLCAIRRNRDTSGNTHEIALVMNDGREKGSPKVIYYSGEGFDTNPGGRGEWFFNLAPHNVRRNGDYVDVMSLPRSERPLLAGVHYLANPTLEDRAAVLWSHEIGHVHEAGFTKEERAAIMAWHEDTTMFTSEYGRDSQALYGVSTPYKEWFAESYAAWRHGLDVDIDPRLVELFERKFGKRVVNTSVPDTPKVWYRHGAANEYSEFTFDPSGRNNPRMHGGRGTGIATGQYSYGSPVGAHVPKGVALTPVKAPVNPIFIPNHAAAVEFRDLAKDLMRRAENENKKWNPKWTAAHMVDDQGGDWGEGWRSGDVVILDGRSEGYGFILGRADANGHFKQINGESFEYRTLEDAKAAYAVYGDNALRGITSKDIVLDANGRAIPLRNSLHDDAVILAKYTGTSVEQAERDLIEAIKVWQKHKQVHPINLVLHKYGHDGIEMGDGLADDGEWGNVKFPPMDDEGKVKLHEGTKDSSTYLYSDEGPAMVTSSAQKALDVGKMDDSQIAEWLHATRTGDAALVKDVHLTQYRDGDVVFWFDRTHPDFRIVEYRNADGFKRWHVARDNGEKFEDVDTNLLSLDDAVRAMMAGERVSQDRITFVKTRSIEAAHKALREMTGNPDVELTGVKPDIHGLRGRAVSDVGQLNHANDLLGALTDLFNRFPKLRRDAAKTFININTPRAQAVYAPDGSFMTWRWSGFSIEVIEANRKFQLRYGRPFSVYRLGEEIAGNVRHEYCHCLQSPRIVALWKEAEDKAVPGGTSAWVRWYKQHISDYDPSNPWHKPREHMADAFVFYTDPRYERGSLPEAIETFFDMLVEGEFDR